MPEDDKDNIIDRAVSPQELERLQRFLKDPDSRENKELKREIGEFILRNPIGRKLVQEIIDNAANSEQDPEEE